MPTVGLSKNREHVTVHQGSVTGASAEDAQAKFAEIIARGGRPKLTLAGEAVALSLPREAASLIAGINGKRSLAEIAQASGMDQLRFGALWRQVEEQLTGWGVLLYSGLLR